MHRILAVTCLSALCLLAGNQMASAANNETLADLKAWVGKYPADLVDGQTVWDNKELKEKVLKFIGPKTQNYIFNEIGREVALPVDDQNDILTFFVCKAHACPEASALFFVDIPKDRVFICWTYATEKEDLWLSAAADPKPIGAGGCIVSNPYDLLRTYGKD